MNRQAGIPDGPFDEIHGVGVTQAMLGQVDRSGLTKNYPRSRPWSIAPMVSVTATSRPD